MSIELFEHNQKSYMSATKMLREKGKAAIVHPTGTGKSFIGFKLCEDNPQKIICWLSPSEYIFKTQMENLSKVTDGYTPENIRFITYAKLMNMSEEEMGKIQPDYIILDEFHRCGAEQWGAGVNKFLHIFTDTPVLGLSATAIRYLDNQRDNYQSLSNEQIKRLKDLGIIWNCESVSWETAFNYAVEYSKEHGTLQMPGQYKDRDGFCLGNWIRAQRKKKFAGTLSAERINRLEAIGMDWISKRAREWEIHFENSKIYFEQHGNLNMPTSFVDDTGFNLGRWVRRMEKEKSKLKVSGENGNQIARLEKIGIHWE